MGIQLGPEKSDCSKQLDDNFFEERSPLSRVKEEAPYFPRCSSDKTAVLVRPVEYALKHPYMQVNRPGMVSWLIFDLDHGDPWIWSWESENLPEPNLIVVNRKSNHSHLFYAITPVCTTNKARSKPIQYMNAIYEAFASRLKADPSYSGPVAKTPGHLFWKTVEIHNHVYELGELADSVELTYKAPWSKSPNIDEVAHSRHCTLFEKTRHYAYSIVNRERETGTYESFFKFVEAYAFNENSFVKQGYSSNLTASQVKATVKSISRWSWDKYHSGAPCNKGVMQLGEQLTLTEKQRLSAIRTHNERKKGTRAKITRAVNTLCRQGKELNYSSVARITGLSRQTIAKYKELLKPSSQIIKLNEVFSRSETVNYGVHQITAEEGEALFPPKTLNACHQIQKNTVLPEPGFLKEPP